MPKPEAACLKRIDLLIGAVLVAAAAASALGVATYEDLRGAQTFAITFPTRAVALDVPAATQQGSGTVEIPIEINATNLAQVSVNVTVAGAGPRLQPVEVRAELVPPAGLNATSGEGTVAPAATGGSVTIPLVVAVQDVPEARTVRAASPDAAVAQATPGGAAGRGTWTLVVSIATGLPGQAPAEAFDIRVDAQALVFEAQAQVDIPDAEQR